MRWWKKPLEFSHFHYCTWARLLEGSSFFWNCLFWAWPFRLPFEPATPHSLPISFLFTSVRQSHFHYLSPKNPIEHHPSKLVLSSSQWPAGRSRTWSSGAAITRTGLGLHIRNGLGGLFPCHRRTCDLMTMPQFGPNTTLPAQSADYSPELATNAKKPFDCFQKWNPASQDDDLPPLYLFQIMWHQFEKILQGVPKVLKTMAEALGYVSGISGWPLRRERIFIWLDIFWYLY